MTDVTVKPCRSVLMVGTNPNVRGGISTVVRGYYSGGLFERFDIRYVPTHRDGSAARKAVAALEAYVSLARLLFTANAPLVAHPPVFAGVVLAESHRLRDDADCGAGLMSCTSTAPSSASFTTRNVEQFQSGPCAGCSSGRPCCWRCRASGATS